jgi:hypothetical protein
VFVEKKVPMMSNADDLDWKHHNSLVIELADLVSTVQLPATKKAKNIQLSRDTFAKLCNLTDKIRSTLPTPHESNISALSSKLDKVLECISKGANQKMEPVRTYASVLSACMTESPIPNRLPPQLPLTCPSSTPRCNQDLEIMLKQKDHTKPALAELSLAEPRVRINNAFETTSIKRAVDDFLDIRLAGRHHSSDIYITAFGHSDRNQMEQTIHTWCNKL